MAIELPKNFEKIYEEGEGDLYLKNYVDGKWDFYTDEFKDIRNPFDGSIVGYVPNLGSNHVEHAIGVARDNRSSIRNVPGIERIELFENAADIVEKHQDLLVESLVQEAGKPPHNAKGEVQATINRMKLTAEEARHIYGEYVPGNWSEDTMQEIAIVLREPVGMVLAISPFNYPLFITSTKVVPALLAGNSCVVKLPSADPMTFLLFTRLLEEAALPSGALNVLTASGKAVSEHVDDWRINAISFTGSTSVGKSIAQKAGMKQKLRLELGGNGAAIVLPSADLDLAAEKVVHGSLNFSGQRCDAIARVIVVDEIADEFVSKVKQEVNSIQCGDPMDDETFVGPLIDEDAVDNVNHLVQDAIEKGATCIQGGNCDGQVFEPTILDNVPRNAEIMHEETFGPVVTIHRVNDVDEAITVANDTRYGLDSCVFTNNFYESWKVAKGLKDGEITVNNAPSHGVGFFPFGGTAESGTGREGIGYSIEEMTRLKTVVFNLAPAELGKKRKIYRI